MPALLLLILATASAQTVTISPPGGTFTAPQQATLSTTVPCPIRYTLDGSTPGQFSPLYSNPFTLSTSATVAAKADCPQSSAAFTIQGGPGGPISFTTAATNLSALMAQWYAEEQVRQNKPNPSWRPWGIGVLDFNRDGCMDLMVIHHSSLPDPPGSKIFLNDCAGLNWTGASMGAASHAVQSTMRPLLIDADGDTWTDVIGFGLGWGQVSWKNVAGTLVAQPTYPPTQSWSPSPLLSATQREFNGDGRPDFDGYEVPYGSAAAWQGNYYKFQWNAAAQKFDRTAFIPGPVPAGLPASTVDEFQSTKAANPSFWMVEFLPISGGLIGRGFGGYCPPASRLLRFLAGAAPPYLEETTARGLPLNGVPVYVGDLDNDGDEDVIVSMVANVSGVYLNDGNGYFARIPGAFATWLEGFSTENYMTKIIPADFNADGLKDLVSVLPLTTTHALWQNNGSGQFAQVLAAQGWVDDVAVADFNADGKLDLAIGGPGGMASQQITVYLGN